MDEAGPRTHLMETVGPATYLPYDPAIVGGRMEAAHAPGSGRTAVDLLLQRNAGKLRRAGIELGKDVIDRAFAWVSREQLARAERQRPVVMDVMEAYERALRASYVTDDDVLAHALATRGRFD
jgi:hypothetical protein